MSRYADPVYEHIRKRGRTGRSKTTLAPKGTATRAEACTIIIKATLK